VTTIVFRTLFCIYILLKEIDVFLNFNAILDFSKILKIFVVKNQNKLSIYRILHTYNAGLQ